MCARSITLLFLLAGLSEAVKPHPRVMLGSTANTSPPTSFRSTACLMQPLSLGFIEVRRYRN